MSILVIEVPHVVPGSAVLGIIDVGMYQTVPQGIAVAYTSRPLTSATSFTVLVRTGSAPNKQSSHFSCSSTQYLSNTRGLQRLKLTARN